jgi:CUE domain
MNQPTKSDAGLMILSELRILQGGEQGPRLPSARQMSTIGGLLFRITGKGDNHDPEDYSDLLLAYQHLIETLPEVHWKYVFDLLQKAVDRLSSSSSSSTLDDLLVATNTLHGLLTHSPKACQIAYSTKWVATLSAIYDRFVVLLQKNTNVHTSSNHSKGVLLATLSSLLFDGLFLPRRQPQHQQQLDGDLVEDLLGAIRAMEEHSIECLGDLQDWQSRNDPMRRTIESQVLQYISSQDEQRTYILNMLESARRKESSTPNLLARDTSSKTTNDKRKPTMPKVVTAAADELERRIQKIKLILPEFGEGFIETALSLYQGDVERTVDTLMNDASSYPIALRVLDRSLPRRRKDRTADEIEESTKARQLVKERVAVEEKQEQARYRALQYMAAKEEEAVKQEDFRSEYDDDYDDQYDEVDAKLGIADEGQYDFEQVKLYNKVVRSEEAEDSFWQENANTNRKMPNKNESKGGENGRNGGDGQQWGRDKIKGGRVIGPDGKIDRKPGGQRGKKNMGVGPTLPSTQVGNEGSSNNVNAKAPASGGSISGSTTKPRTKPKSQNKVTRQRDKKQIAQGTFGATN